MMARVFEGFTAAGTVSDSNAIPYSLSIKKEPNYPANINIASQSDNLFFLCRINMDNQTKKDLINYLSGFVADRRMARLREVLSYRTSHLRIVLENVYQAHNASAVLRSCDIFGVQDVHFIENRNQMRISDDVAMGSSNWLTVHRHNREENNTGETLRYLKSLGYKIVATTPHRDEHTIHQMPVNEKIALVFGTEIEGISQDVIDHADAFVRVPMYGFTESFNISVCAALCMYELTTRIRESIPDHGLTEQEQLEVMFEWLRTSVEHGDALIRDYLAKRTSK
jgi:tRNA (guanosine-2'-O-)-methyltransferase